jgi:hypothetical protein
MGVAILFWLWVYLFSVYRGWLAAGLAAQAVLGALGLFFVGLT